ncbi:hypothetical protein NAD41_002358 [Salmonella enterica]|nr:hypothetical protein [Salmonella enterica]EKK6596326.1 hypothetical protein [Salmonella enterica]
MREPMTFPQLINALNRLAMTGSGRGGHAERLVIPVELPHASIGATPSVAVVNVSAGIDWDSGTVFLHPQQKLTPLSPDELEEIKQCRKDGQSWAVCKAHERFRIERDDLVDTIHKLRTALLQRGMSTDELAALAGEAPAIRPRRRKVNP